MSLSVGLSTWKSLSEPFFCSGKQTNEYKKEDKSGV